jgi:CRISPR-associated protein Cmr4
MKNTASAFYYLHALSPLHVGVGQGSGIIDLPIAREKATHLPFVPGSGLKGVLREELRDDSKISNDEWQALFGPDKVSDNDMAFAGALLINDAHLLCLPVRSLAGTFAWATCPFVLARYAREAKVLNLANIPKLPTVGAEDALTAEATVLEHDGCVVLEDLDLSAQLGDAEAWAQHIAEKVFPGDQAWQGMFKERFTILPDGIFDFLAETATEIRTRVKINHETRVVERGALWSEENLPIETVLYGVVNADKSRKDKHSADAQTMLGKLPTSTRLQLGGKATVGRGLVNWIKGA